MVSEQWEIRSGASYVVQTADGGYALSGAVKINDTEWGVGLTKLNRDPALPPESPTPTASPTGTPENNPTEPAAVDVAVAAVSTAVVVVSAGLAVYFKKRKR